MIDRALFADIARLEHELIGLLQDIQRAFVTGKFDVAARDQLEQAMGLGADLEIALAKLGVEPDEQATKIAIRKLLSVAVTIHREIAGD